MRVRSEFPASATRPHFARKLPHLVQRPSTTCPSSTEIHRRFPVASRAHLSCPDSRLAKSGLSNSDCAPASANRENSAHRAPYRVPPSQPCAAEILETRGNDRRHAIQSLIVRRQVHSKLRDGCNLPERPARHRHAPPE